MKEYTLQEVLTYYPYLQIEYEKSVTIAEKRGYQKGWHARDRSAKKQIDAIVSQRTAKENANKE